MQRRLVYDPAIEVHADFDGRTCQEMDAIVPMFFPQLRTSHMAYCNLFSKLRMKPFLETLLAVMFCVNFASAGQENLPVLKAKSASIDIIDGHNLRKGHWSVSPDVPLDTYYAQRFAGTKKITFRSDVDSRSFDVKPGEDYDFIILLNGKECRTRISTLRRPAVRTDQSDAKLPAAIPFTIGPDHKIHIEGTINNSVTLDFMFDTGADNIVLYKSGYDKKVALKFDGEIDNSGLGGTSKRKTSNENKVAISDLVWDHELVMYIENQADRADGIIGYNIFEDKVLEIDYDRMQILVHDKLPSMTAYAKAEMRFPGTIPVLETTLDTGKSKISDWLVIDTGYSGSVYLNHAFLKKHSFHGSMKSLGTNRSRGVGSKAIDGEYVLLPELTLGGATLSEIPISVELPSDEPQDSSGLLGMDVLKRFNTVLDYQTNTVYLKPNSLFAVPFRQPPFRPTLLMIAIVALTVSEILILVVRRRRKASRERQQSDSTESLGSL